MNKKDYTIYFVLSNFLCFIIIFIISLIVILYFFKNIFVRIVCAVVLFYLCGQFETRVIVRIVNPIVTFFLPKEIRREEMELSKKIRNHEKKVRKK